MIAQTQFRTNLIQTLKSNYKNLKKWCLMTLHLVRVKAQAVWVAVWHGLISAVMQCNQAFIYLSSDEGLMIEFLGTIEHLLII